MNDESDEYWREKLTPEQYKLMRQKGTEYPGSGKYTDTYDDGIYRCIACGHELFKSETKYESTIPGLIGWPSFSEMANNEAVDLVDDNSMGMQRTEVVCKNCGGHLGHIFPDDTSTTGQHYCVNSASLDFEAKK